MSKHKVVTRACIYLSFLVFAACGGNTSHTQNSVNAQVNELTSAVRQGLRISTTHDSSHLSWQAYSSTEGEVSYNVYRDDILIATLKSPFYTDLGLSAQTSYQYFITARVNRQSEYQLSDILQVSTRPKPKAEQKNQKNSNRVFAVGNGGL